MTATLGLFVWYAINGDTLGPLDVDRSTLLGWMQEAGVDESFLPAPARGIDAFRCATSTATDEYEIPDPGGGRGTWVRLVIRETDSGESFVMRRVYRIATEPDGEPVERRVANLQFFRPRRKMTGRVPGSERLQTLVDQRLRGLDRQRVTALVKRCVVAYETHRRKILGSTLRTHIRNHLLGLSAVATANNTHGGTYLLPPDRLDEVQRVQSVIRSCGPGCRLRILPVPPDPDLREMVVTSVDTDIQGRAMSLRHEVLMWVDRNGRAAPTAHRLAGWEADYRFLQQVALEWMELLDEDAFGQAADGLEQAMAVIEQVGRRRSSRTVGAQPKVAGHSAG